ncbi:MAG: hypothetical protein EOM50_09715 [Erysipelotrichia bacterium]|nr:hypothetical protein [Erysipelotrichia bacterium]NCC54763.1 hypothetical protein [Erysipelotrichia bacterium]
MSFCWRIQIVAKVHIRDLLKKKEVDPNKKVELEKNDIWALIIAAISVFGPILLAALFILFIFIAGWNAFFH